MSLSRKIAAEVDDLVKTSAHPRLIEAEDGHHKINMPINRATPISIECAGFDFQVANHPEMTIDELRSWGDRVAQTVTYLLEPLAVQEADATRGEVLLRSESPTNKPEKRSYYEVQLKKQGQMKFNRIAYQEDTRSRGPIPCHFTNEVVERLVDDLVKTAP